MADKWLNLTRLELEVYIDRSYAVEQIFDKNRA
jgi:hypothetical protein